MLGMHGHAEEDGTLQGEGESSSDNTQLQSDHEHCTGALTTLTSIKIDHNVLDIKEEIEDTEPEIISVTEIYVPVKSEQNEYSFQLEIDNIDQQDNFVADVSEDSMESIDVPLNIRLQKSGLEARSKHDTDRSKRQLISKSITTKDETGQTSEDKPKTKYKNANKDTDYIPDEMEPKNTPILKPSKMNEKNTKLGLKKKYRYLISKYKIVVCKDYEDFKKCVKKVKVDLDVILSCMENDRNSELFRNLKYKCEKCVEPIPETHTDKHAELHVKSSTRQFFCDVCERTFLNIQSVRTHTPKHSCVYQCLVCGIRMCSRLLMRRHLKYHSTKVQCARCDAAFPSKQDAVQHYRDLHTKFICDHCGNTFCRKSLLQWHLWHDESWHCTLCNKSFKNYDRHVKIHHSTQVTEQTFCVECNIRFKSIYAYKEHFFTSRVHNAERFEKMKQTRHSCPDCSKVYKSGDALRNHHDYIHKGQSRFKCPHCDKLLLSATRLRDHTRKVHLGLRPAKNKICYMCGKGFSTNIILIHHMRTHTGEKPYSCVYCNASFAQKVTMNNHVKNKHLKASGGGAVCQR